MAPRFRSVFVFQYNNHPQIWNRSKRPTFALQSKQVFPNEDEEGLSTRSPPLSEKRLSRDIDTYEPSEPTFYGDKWQPLSPLATRKRCSKYKRITWFMDRSYDMMAKSSTRNSEKISCSGSKLASSLVRIVWNSIQATSKAEMDVRLKKRWDPMQTCRCKGVYILQRKT